MKQIVIITKGLPGCGKSEWAKKFVHEHPGYYRINRDDLRFMMLDGYFDAERERAITRTRDWLIMNLLFIRSNLVLDEAYLLPHRIKELNETLEDIRLELGIELEIKIQDFTHVPLEECIKRDKGRGRDREVGEKTIREYYEKYVKPVLTKTE